MEKILKKVAEKLKEIKEASKKEWKDMPEYNFTERKPMRTLRINFVSEEDIEDFAKLIGQKIYPTRNTYWYPENKVSLYSDMVYVDEDES